MRVSTWDDEKDPVFRSALGRLGTLCPNAGSTQTHLLHLASDGEILPHIDNADASGSWILGVSLGSDRVLRMESVETDSDCSARHTFDVTLPSGSVYIQRCETRLSVVLLLTHWRDDVRYNYKHSILCTEQGASRGQRLSIMVRVGFRLLPILQEIMNKLLRFLKDCPFPIASQGVAPPNV